MSRVGAIEARLNSALNPESMDVVDDSHKHAGHAGAASGGGHFDLTIVSEQFAGLTTLMRHRLIYDALGEMMQTQIHALSIKAYSPQEI